MADNTRELLDEFETAVRNDAIIRAQETLRALNDGYNDQFPEKEVRITQVFQARDNLGLGPNERESLQEYISIATAAGLSRASFLTTAAAYLSDPSKVDRNNILRVTNTLQRRETELDRAEPAAADQLETVTLPPLMSVLTAELPTGPYLKGESLTATVLVQNVGDASAEQVTIGVNQPSGLTINPERAKVGMVSADERITMEFDVVLEQQGRYTLRFSLESAAAGDETETIDVEVDTKADLLNTVIESFSSLVEQIRQIDTIPRGKRKSLVQKIKRTEQKVEKAEAFMPDERPQKANNMLNAATRILGALLNELDALSKNQRNEENGPDRNDGNTSEISVEQRAVLQSLVERMIDLLTAARKAKS